MWFLTLKSWRASLLSIYAVFSFDSEWITPECTSTIKDGLLWTLEPIPIWQGRSNILIRELEPFAKHVLCSLYHGKPLNQPLIRHCSYDFFDCGVSLEHLILRIQASSYGIFNPSILQYDKIRKYDNEYPARFNPIKLALHRLLLDSCIFVRYSLIFGIWWVSAKIFDFPLNT